MPGEDDRRSPPASLTHKTLAPMRVFISLDDSKQRAIFIFFNIFDFVFLYIIQYVFSYTLMD